MRLHLLVIALLTIASNATANTYTPLLNLCKPSVDTYDWLDCINNNFDILDSSNVQTNASGLTTGSIANYLLDSSSVTLYGPKVPAEKIDSGILPANVLATGYGYQSIPGTAIKASTIPLSALNQSGCAIGQVAYWSGSVWGCQDTLTSSIIPQWTKYTFTFDQFSVAAYSSSVYIATLPAKTIVHAVFVKQSASFSGGALGSYSVSVGTGMSEPSWQQYSIPFDVNVGPAANYFQLTTGYAADNYSSSYPIYITAQSVGAQLDIAEQGSVDIWLLKSSLP